MSKFALMSESELSALENACPWDYPAGYDLESWRREIERAEEERAIRRALASIVAAKEYVLRAEQREREAREREARKWAHVRANFRDFPRESILALFPTCRVKPSDAANLTAWSYLGAWLASQDIPLARSPRWPQTAVEMRAFKAGYQAERAR